MALSDLGNHEGLRIKISEPVSNQPEKDRRNLVLAMEMKILEADEAKVTNKGLEVRMPEFEKTFADPTLNAMPPMRKF